MAKERFTNLHVDLLEKVSNCGYFVAKERLTNLHVDLLEKISNCYQFAC